MNLLFLAISAVLAYLIGSIPVAYIFGRVLKGIDIREHGSGNMGATNAFRVLGKGPGVIVLILDIVKGIIPVTLLANAFGLADPLSLVIIAVAVVAGHNWPVFLGFKGGKGMATSLGVLIGLGLQLPGLRIVLGLSLGARQGQIDRAQIQFNLADTLELMSRTEDAIAEYLKIPDLYPNEQEWDVKAYLRVAKIYEEGEDWEGARVTYQKIIQLNTPEAAFAQERLDWIKNNAGKVRKL